MSGQQEGICPICMEEMDLTDQELQPCACGYKICLWCWHFIIQTAEKDGSDARCPACRCPYDKEKILERKISKERLAMVNANKLQVPQRTKQRAPDVGKDPYNIRVIKRNIVYIAGLPKNLSDEKILRKKEYLGQYGKIIKIFFTQRDGSRQYYSSESCIVYVTFSKEVEAFRCIQVVNGYLLNGRPLKASFGTTRYCHSFLKNLPCKNPNCSYVHDVVPQEDICEREDVISFCTSKLQQCPGLGFPDLKQHSGSFLPPPLETKNSLPQLGLIKNNRCMERDYFQRSYSSVAASDNHSKFPSCSSSRATQRSNLSTPPGFPPIKNNQGITNQSRQHNSSSSENATVNRCVHPDLSAPNSGIEENLPAASRHLASLHSSNYGASQYWNAIDGGAVGRHLPRITGISSAAPELQHEQQHQSLF